MTQYIVESTADIVYTTEVEAESIEEAESIVQEMTLTQLEQEYTRGYLTILDVYEVE